MALPPIEPIFLISDMEVTPTIMEQKTKLAVKKARHLMMHSSL